MPSLDQQGIWEQEHSNPLVLPQMDKQDASRGVADFFTWLVQKRPHERLAGVEMGCGKGRNCLWLARQGFKMTGFDFSKNAIEEAKKRAKQQQALAGVDFLVHDATKEWPFAGDSFDFGIDCFASTDIDSPRGRSFARDEFKRVLKKGGFLLVYTLSTDDEFHEQMVEQHQKEIKAEQMKTQKALAALEKRKVSKLTEALVKAEVLPEMLDLLVLKGSASVRLRESDTDWEEYVADERGVQLVSDGIGTPMGIDSFVQQILKAQYPGAFKGTGSSGGGAPRSNAGGGGSGSTQVIAAGDSKAFMANLKDIAAGKVTVASQ